MKDYYWCDYLELEAIKAENVKLKQQINNLVDEILELKKRRTKSEKV